MIIQWRTPICCPECLRAASLTGDFGRLRLFWARTSGPNGHAILAMITGYRIQHWQEVRLGMIELHYTLCSSLSGNCGLKLTHPVALFGQASLPIYTMHTFALPGLGWRDRLFIVEGVSRIILPFLIFAVYCAIVMDYYHRKTRHSRFA